MGILLNKSKNYIINGAMDFWQRGTSFAAAVSAYHADRFAYGKNGTMVQTLSRDTDVPTLSQIGIPVQYSYRMNLTTPQASITAANYTEIYHNFEGSVVAPLYGKDITLSFWVKATLVGKYYVAFRNNGGARSLVRSFDVLLSDVWEKKTITIKHNTTGSWPIDTSLGMIVSWTIAGGSNYTAPAENVWYSTNYNNGPGQVNGVQSGSTNFRITGIQLEEGVSASNFERAGGNVASEMTLCQRYYEKSYDINTNIGTPTYVGAFFATCINSADNYNYGYMVFKVPKRSVPTMGAFNPVSGAVGTWYDVSLGAANGSYGTNNVSSNGVGRTYNISSSWVAGRLVSIHWTADAEL